MDSRALSQSYAERSRSPAVAPDGLAGRVSMTPWLIPPCPRAGGAQAAPPRARPRDRRGDAPPRSGGGAPGPRLLELGLEMGGGTPADVAAVPDLGAE